MAITRKNIVRVLRSKAIELFQGFLKWNPEALIMMYVSSVKTFKTFGIGSYVIFLILFLPPSLLFFFINTDIYRMKWPLHTTLG